MSLSFAVLLTKGHEQIDVIRLQTLKAGINSLMEVVTAHFGAAADMLQTWACRFGSDDDIVASAPCF